jgi:uncharacterized protein YjgD (DUF1641 family)
MAGFGSKINRKQEDAIAALLSQRNVEEAARAAKIGVRTLYRWLKDPDFDTAFRQARRAAFGRPPRFCNKLLRPPPRYY